MKRTCLRFGPPGFSKSSEVRCPYRPVRVWKVPSVVGREALKFPPKGNALTEGLDWEWHNGHFRFLGVRPSIGSVVLVLEFGES